MCIYSTQNSYCSPFRGPSKEKIGDNKGYHAIR